MRTFQYAIGPKNKTPKTCEREGELAVAPMSGGNIVVGSEALYKVVQKRDVVQQDCWRLKS